MSRASATIEPTRITVHQFLAFEDELKRIGYDVRLLKDVSVNHGEMIRELMGMMGNSVSRAELMAAITTTRYQQLRVSIDTDDDDSEFGSSTKSLSMLHFNSY